MLKRLSRQAVYTIISICLSIIIVAFCLRGYYMLETRIHKLEDQLILSTLTDFDSAVDFYKSQMQTLTWLLGIIITIICACFAFFGFNTKKSIEENYNINFQKLLTAKDTKIFQKKVIVLYKKLNSILKFCNEIRDQGYNISVKEIEEPIDKSLLNGASIIIYCLNDEDDESYNEIAEECENKKIHCIIFCQNLIIPRKFTEKKTSYISISNYIAKLRESLYILLYLTP